jgi:type I restriction enzyme, S subunit
MNRTLEAMAQVLFQSWFVDLDPVRAKMAGRQPAGMDAETAALFPDSLGSSQLGDIPRHWAVVALGEIATSVRDVVDPCDVDQRMPYIGLEHMPRRSLALGEWGLAGDVGSAKSRFMKGDILFGKLRPYFHKVGVAPIDGVCSTDILTVRPNDYRWLGFVLGHLSSDALIDYADGCSAGTRMPRVSWSDLRRYPVICPPDDVAAALTNATGPMLHRIHASILESRSLAALRDALLPMLLSGKLRVPDAEKCLEAVL